jgi:hypothetical protein
MNELMFSGADPTYADDVLETRNEPEGKKQQWLGVAKVFLTVAVMATTSFAPASVNATSVGFQSSLRSAAPAVARQAPFTLQSGSDLAVASQQKSLDFDPDSMWQAAMELLGDDAQELVAKAADNLAKWHDAPNSGKMDAWPEDFDEA